MELATSYMDEFTQHLNSIAHLPWFIVLDNLDAGFTMFFELPGAEFSSTTGIFTTKSLIVRLSYSTHSKLRFSSALFRTVALPIQQSKAFLDR